MSSFTYIELKEKAHTHKPVDLVNSLSFNDSVDLACNMLNNDEWDEALHQYAVTVLEELRKTHPEKWDSLWRYDALLGYAYDIVLDYDKRYAAFRRAYDKVSPSPPELLVGLAYCFRAPGPCKITEEEAIKLVKQAIKDKLYIEAVNLLKGLYNRIGNTEEHMYWKGIYEKIEETGVHLPPLDEIPREER